MKHDIVSDTTYNAGLPSYSEQQIAAIYEAAGVDIVTGLPVKRITRAEDCVISVGPDTKPTSGKLALASGNLSAGVLSFDAPTWAFIAAAKSCGCISCEGVLANIQSSAAWNKSNIKLGRPTAHSMSNIHYFIHRLRGIVMSRTLKHNPK